MTTQARELLSGPTTRSGFPRLTPAPGGVKTVRFAAGTALLPAGTPVARNSSTGFWVPWAQGADAMIFTVTNASTDVDGGSFILRIDGLSVELAWNVTAAAAVTEINAVLLAARRPYTVSAVCTEANLGVAAAVLTVTFSENAGAPSVEYDGEDVTDGGVSEPHTFAVSDAGTALNDTSTIRAFVYEGDGQQLVAGGESLGVVMFRGEVYRHDVNTATIRAVLVGSPSEAELDAALVGGRPTLRELGIDVRGVAGVA